MRTWWKTGQIGFSNRFKDYLDQRLNIIEVDGSDADKIVASLASTS
jgi:hypothetical protein